MASVLGWVVFGAYVGLSAMQSIYVWMYCRFLRSDVAAEVDPAFEPKAAVILCLRGNDPTLEACLEGLAGLDYRNYEIHIVVDEELDPALDQVRRYLPTVSGVPTQVHVISDKSTSCSLKCSAILTALTHLDDDVDVIALIDADSVADPCWLKDLVHPLADPSVGATTGNRWFTPKTGHLGSLVRQHWNAAAIAQMSFYQIPWGGSLAMRRTTISECNLPAYWGKGFCEDTMLSSCLERNSLRVVRVPDLIVANQESTSVSEAFRWIVRQLLTVRLYHPDWPLVLVHGLFLGICLVSAMASIGVSIATGEWYPALVVLAAFGIYNASNAILLRAIVSGNERAIESRRVFTVPTHPRAMQVLIGMLLTQLIQPAAAITAALTRHISWRGITYKIGKHRQIEMIRYQPYREVLDRGKKSANTSIE